MRSAGPNRSRRECTVYEGPDFRKPDCQGTGETEKYYSDEKKPASFCTGEVTLDKRQLTNADGNTKQLKAGMSAEVNIVTATSKVKIVLLKSINLID